MSREGAVDEEAHFSPSRIKFPCSYGGKILPRPSDGQLKYIGGETRIISVPRSITFQELKDKVSGMFNNTDVVIKYQIYPEDLDTLVSVRSDEDLKYMFEEYDRHESIPRSPSSSPRFRIFVFPSTKTTSSTPSPTHRASKIPIATGTPHTMFGFNSPSPDTSPPNSIFNSTVKSSSDGSRPLGLQRVRSTPNLSQMGNNNSNIGSPLIGSRVCNNSPPLHYNQPSQYRNMGQHGGGMSRVGVSYRYETCVCGRVILGHQRRRGRHQHPPFGGHMCPHHNAPSHECRGMQNNSVNGSVNLGGNSPRLRQTSIWE